MNAQAQRAINDADRVTLHGNVHPLARAEFDRGSAPASQPMNNMILQLGVRADAQAQLNQLLAEQQDPNSPNYHKWLTPMEFGLRFGPTDQDIADASNWLRSFGFKIEQVATSRTSINFSGNVEKVERAFQTNIRQYEVNGKMHFANATDPSIPRALTGLVQGVVTLHNFEKRHFSTATQLPPDFNNGGQHYLAPGDVSIIYDAFPLYTQVPAIDGTGQKIAIVGRTDINLADVQFFRSFFGLPANDPTFINNGPDPGIVTTPGEETEADLDVEWAGAIAKNASVLFVISQTTATTDGVDLSAQYIVNNNLAPIMSTSFGRCESDMSPTEQSFWAALWAQAASQGITSFVSAGDSGAACDAPTSTTGTKAGINGVASTVNNVAVGGTEFNEGAGTFWNTSNSPTDQSSALGYIPENVWNESGNVAGGSGLWSTGGGVSGLYAKPTWQVGLGVPNDGFRDIPDVSLSAAAHDGYVIVQGHTASNSGLLPVNGTSASSPTFASIMALVVQKNGAQGNANTVLYSMAQNQFNGTGLGVFHDVTIGDNSVPGITGFTAGTGYDQASGWGSPDVNQLVKFWNNNAGQPDFIVRASPSASTVAQNSSTTFTVVVTAVNNYTGTVSFSVNGLPAGATASFAPASVANSGTSVLTITTAAATALGTYPLSIFGSDGTVGHSAQVTLTVANPDFSIAASPASQSVNEGSSTSYTVTQTAINNYAATVSYSVTGLPTGATFTFTPPSINTSGTTTLTVAAGTTTPAGSYTLTITGSDGTIAHSTTVTLVVAAVDFSISASPASQSVNQGNSTSYTVTQTAINGYAGTVTYSVAGLPTGASATFAPPTVTASGTTALSVSTVSTTPTGTYTLTITGTDSVFTHSTTVTLVVSTPDFSLSVTPSSQTINQGNPTSYTVTLNSISGYSGTVSFGLSGQPAGVTFNFAPATVTASGSTVLNIATATTTTPGTYTLTINATDGTITHTIPVTLVVTPAGDFQISTSIASQTVNPGLSTSYGITVTSLNGFSGAVSLSLSGLPAGATATFNPGSIVGAGTSSLAVSTSPSTPAGVYNMVVTGTSGAIVHTVSVQLIVNPATPGDFSLSTTPSGSLTVKRSNNKTGNIVGTRASFTITVTPSNGFNGNVALSVSGFPAGVTDLGISPNTVTGGSGSATESFAVSGSAKQGTYPITITGTSGSLVHTIVVNLVVN
ncbi:MAG TPA: protease pro-enzyme activation domain-containing protein [Candidatus Angelobacter sp.]|nr:protease pro-enzyme activation domain-containing protein [Candidatus Angelobacter sp.]